MFILHVAGMCECKI